MRYKRMGRNRSYQVDVPQLSGGVNVLDHPTKIEDDELTAARNLRWKNGALRKRQAVRAVGTAPFVSIKTSIAYPLHRRADYIHPHPIDVDGELCTIVHSGACYGSSVNTDDSTNKVQVISLDGNIRATYILNEWAVRKAAFAPCDKLRYGCSFLMFVGIHVYKPNDVTGFMDQIGDDALYAPLVMINAKSVSGDESAAVQNTANGVMYEGFNLLTRRFRAKFTSMGSGAAEIFKLPVSLQNGTSVVIEHISASGTSVYHATVGGTVEDNNKTIGVGEDGMISVYHAFPKSEIADNVTITATAKDAESLADLEMPCAMWFGGTQNKLGGTRLFLAGFAKDQAVVRWSDVNNPLYFPENNYMAVGDLSQRITALEKQGDKLVIFKEREVYYTTYVQGEIDADSIANGINVDVTASQAYFPLTQLSPYIGCDAPYSLAICRDRLVWMCSDGRVYTLVEGSPYSERNVREIGQKIAPLTQAHDKALLKRASAMDHDGCYVLMIGNEAYSFDYSNSGFASLTSYSSGEKAGRRIAWYTHKFDGFSSQETLRLVSDGARHAILISTSDTTVSPVTGGYTHVRMLYRFVDASDDSHATVTKASSDGLNTTVTDHPITASLMTKIFDFGNISSFKSIDALYIAAQADSVTLAFYVDDIDAVSVHHVKNIHAGGRLVLPGVKRCRTFAISLTSTDALELLGIRLQYTPFGTVR